MTALRNAIADVRRAKTWTERIYYVSPVLEAVAKQLRSSRSRSKNAATETNSKWAPHINRANREALTALGLNDVDRTAIMSGPFEGMAYALDSRGSLVGPKIVGTYEAEISHWIKDLAASETDVIIDVGSAEGYYAVGLACLMKSAQVYAFDADDEAQRLTAQLSKLNGVEERVHVAGFCDPATLSNLIERAKRPALIVDIEGFENDLLDPVLVPQLDQAKILVELHEHLRPGVTTRILDRFAYSHRIEVACTRSDADKVASAVKSGMNPAVARAAVPEGRRLPQLWLSLSPLTHVNV